MLSVLYDNHDNLLLSQYNIAKQPHWISETVLLEGGIYYALKKTIQGLHYCPLSII